MLHCCLSVDRRWECFCNQMGVILTCALMGDFVKEEKFGVRKYTSAFDGLVTGFVDDAVQFAFEVLSIIEHLLLLSFVACVMKGNHPVGIDALL